MLIASSLLTSGLTLTIRERWAFTWISWTTTKHASTAQVNQSLVRSFLILSLKKSLSASPFFSLLLCLLWLIYITRDRLGNRVGFGSQTRWLHCTTQHVHIAQTQTQIPTSYFCAVQESESKFVPESISGNVKLRLRSLLPISVQYRNLSPSL